MRKLILLILLIPFFLVSCKKKEGCSDYKAVNYDPDVEVNNGSCIYEGYVTFFTSDLLDNGPIKVQLNNYDYGYVTSTANITSCEEAGGVNITTYPGDHSYILTDDSGQIGSGYINIEYNACVLFDIP